MKRITCSRKQIIRAIRAACVALFFAACVGQAHATNAPFVQSGTTVATPDADGIYNPTSFTTGSSNYTVTISPESGHTASLYNTDSVVSIGGGSITVTSGILIENTASTNGALEITGNGTVNNAGTVSGYYTGVTIIGAGGASSVMNTGSIEANNTGLGLSATGVYMGGTGSNYGASTYSVTNNGGTITAMTDDYVSGATNVYGVAAYSYDGNISISNNPVNGSGGVITGTGSGYGATVYGIEAASSHDGNVTVNNSGTVVGTVSAVYGVGNAGNAYGVSASSNYGNVMVTNAAGGLIEGTANEGQNAAGFGIDAITDNFGTVTVNNSGTVEAGAIGTSSNSGSAYGIRTYSEGGNINITNNSGNSDIVTATASGYKGNSAFGIYAADGDFGAITITNYGTAVATASSVDGSASAYGIYAISDYEGNVTITNSGLADGDATPTDGTATAYGIKAGSEFGTVMVTNNGTVAATATAADSGSAYAYGVSADSYDSDITITNNLTATGTASASGNYSATGIGLVAGSLYGNVTITNNGLAEGTASSYDIGTSATATGFGISASSYYDTAKIINKGEAYGSGSGFYSGTGYGIYSSNTHSGYIEITNNGEADGTGTATTSYPTTGTPTGMGYGIYASGNFGNISIVNTDFAEGSGTSMDTGGMAAGSGDGIAAKTNSGYISILNTGIAVGSGSGYFSGTGSGIYALSNTGGISIQNKGAAIGSASSYDSTAGVALAYGIYAASTVNSPVMITNSGTAIASATSGIADFGDYSYSPAFASGILVGTPSNSGNIFVSNSGTALGVATVNGSGSGYGYGIDILSTSGNVTIINSGLAGGSGSSYAGAGVGYGVAIQAVSGAVSITNTITGMIEGDGYATSGFAGTGASYGIYLFSSYSNPQGPATINNNGTISADYGIGIFAHGYNNSITVNEIGGAILTTESGTYSSAYRAVLLGASETNTFNIVGQANITGLIDGGYGGDNTLTLHLAGMTPAQKAALQQAVINSASGGYSGAVFAGGVTYSWVNFDNVSGTFVSLEQEVDPGLMNLALRIDDLNTPLPVAYGPFFAAAATGSVEAAMNELVGREINQGIDTIGLSLNTTLASNLDQHLDNLLTGNQIGGVDLGGVHVGEAGSMVAFSDTTSQLESLTRMAGTSAFGGTEMSTDTKAMVAAAPPPPSWGVWASGNVSIADDTGTGGLSNFHSTFGSPTLGLDYRVTPNLVVGIMGSYTTGGANFDDGNRIGLDAEIGALYGTWRDGNWHVNGIAGGGALQLDDSRTTFGGTANSNPGGYDIITDWTGGYDFHLGDGWNVTPELGLQYTHLDINDYTETGAGAFDLDVADQGIDSLRSHVGFNLDKSFKLGPDLTFVPEVRAQWYHEFMDNGRGVDESLTGAPTLGGFDVGTYSPQRDFALVGVGLNTAFTGYKGMPVGLFINYNAQVGQSDYIANSVNAGIRVDF